MPTTFNADEIFEMAEQIERNGARFYRRAANNAPEQATKKMLLEMAEMEDEHLAAFQEMRKNLSDAEKAATAYDPDNQAARYLQTMAESRGCEGKISPDLELTGKETIRQILETALTSEKESVVFYMGMRSLVSEKAGKDKVEAIIHEELGHIASLHAKLMAVDPED
jgi:rubrerythrin